MLSKSRTWTKKGTDFLLLRSRGNSGQQSLTKSAACFHSSSFSAYTSSENEVSKPKIKTEVMSMLSALQTKTRVNTSGYLEVRECHLCDKNNKTKPDNLYKLNIRADGSYYCFRCSCGGNYTELKQKLQSAITIYHSGGGTSTSSMSAVVTDRIVAIDEPSAPISSAAKLPKSVLQIDDPPLKSEENASNVKFVIPDQRLSHQYFLNLFPPESSEEAKSAITPEQEAKSAKNEEYRRIVKEYLHDKRGLDDEVLRKYQVGFSVQQFLMDDDNGESEWKDQLCITFPWIQFADQIVTENGKVKDSFTFSNQDKYNKTKSTKKPVIPHSISIEGNNCYILRTKYRAIQTKGLQRILPKGGSWGFFGWHLTRDPTPVTSKVVTAEEENSAVSAETETRSTKKSSSASKQKKSIIITEGEYDAMAVSQGLRMSCRAADALLKIPVISLPNGCNSLPNKLVALLDEYNQIYLWMDNDKSGHDAVEKFTRKLGVSRCLIVRPPDDMMNPPKDANDALRQDPSLISLMLNNARTLSHDKIQSFTALKQSLLFNIQNRAAGNTVTSEGSVTPSLPGLTDMCKGFRRGEMVVLTGPTGSGKTTLLSQLGLDFATAGSPVLWGSFEVRNAQLSLKMLHQFTKFSAPLHSLPENDVKQIMDDFESLPIQYMNYYGSTPIDTVLETMEYAVDKDDIQHIIIDNLQFMLPRTSIKPTSNAFEKYDLQDFVLDKLRLFATSKNVNLIVVIHPKKEDDYMELGLSSIGGTAKASQEADLVLILQKPGRNGKVALDVKKNRYDGYLGRILLQFNENNHSFSQVSEVIPYHRTGGGYAGANNNYNNNNTSNDNNYENAEGKVVNTTNALGKKIATPARLLWEQAMLKREQSKTVEAVPITNEATQTVSLSNTVEVSMVALEVKSATSNESKEITSVEPPVAPKKRTRKSSTKSNI